MKLTLIFTLTIILFSGLTIFAHENIDVRSVEVKRSLAGQVVSFEMKAINSAGKVITYREEDSFLGIGQAGYERCRPCHSPNLYSTNPFATEFNIEVDQTNIVLKFYITSKDFAPIYLSQRDMIQKRSFNKRGSGVLEGRVEVFDNDGPGIIAVDNDFILKGSYLVRFTAPYFATLSKRWFDQTTSDYFLSETRAQESQAKNLKN